MAGFRFSGHDEDNLIHYKSNSEEMDNHFYNRGFIDDEYPERQSQEYYEPDSHYSGRGHDRWGARDNCVITNSPDYDDDQGGWNDVHQESNRFSQERSDFEHDRRGRSKHGHRFNRQPSSTEDFDSFRDKDYVQNLRDDQFHDHSTDERHKQQYKYGKQNRYGSQYSESESDRHFEEGFRRDDESDEYHNERFRESDQGPYHMERLRDGEPDGYHSERFRDSEPDGYHGDRLGNSEPDEYLHKRIYKNDETNQHHVQQYRREAEDSINNFEQNSELIGINDGTASLVVRNRKSLKLGQDIFNSEDNTSEEGKKNQHEINHLPSRRLGRTKTLRLRKKDLDFDRTISTHEAATLYRDQILQQPVVRGVPSWQYHRKKAWQNFKQNAKNILYQLELWAGAFKTIEGHFGTAVMSYFRFLRWLLFLNLYMTIIMVCLTTIVPSLPLKYVYTETNNTNSNSTNAQHVANCTKQYDTYLNEIRKNETVFNLILDFLQGTGWMEKTILFYGKYNQTYTLSSVGLEDNTYNMGAVYLMATGAVFIISFLLILRNSGKGVKEGVLEDGSQMTQFCNKVFAGWDFCISDSKAALEKHNILGHEFHSDLESQRLVWRKESRTTKDKMKLYTIRVLINILNVFLLVGSIVLIFFVNMQLVELQKEFGNIHPVVQFLIQFLPSLTITILNIIVPIIFKRLVLFEDYLPAFQMKMTLLRIILLRLASLLTLVISLYQQLQSQGQENQDVVEACGNKRWDRSLNQTNSSITVIKCWETYVGQQFYKLVVLDFLVVVVVTFVVEYPRKLIHKKLHERFSLVKMIGQQEFDLPKAVLDIVYSQTLCWMGVFFCPLIPVMNLLKCFLLFYIKKGSLLNNCIQPSRPYRTSKSNSLFIGVLFISFVLSAGPLAYMIGSFSPSQSCGPFRYSKPDSVFFHTINELIDTFPADIQEIILFFGKHAFLVPAVILICFVMYCFAALSTGYQRRSKLLREQLRLEGHDKQFLLARVNEAWQHLEVTNS